MNSPLACLDNKDEWLETAARIGYIARGIVYTLIGLLALIAIFTNQHQTEGSKGVLKVIALQPYGRILLVFIAAGFLCYALWRTLSAILDVRNKGRKIRGLWVRFTDLATGIVNGVLAYCAAQLTWSNGTDGGTQTQLTADVLSVPFGEWAVGLCGAVIGGIGLYQFYCAWCGAFVKKYGQEMPAHTRHTALVIGRVGLLARGVTFLLIGLFFVRAAYQHDASEAGGLQEALQTLLTQAYGPWLLCIVSLGFICYGLSCFAHARYRYFYIDFNNISL